MEDYLSDIDYAEQRERSAETQFQNRVGAALNWLECCRARLQLGLQTHDDCDEMLRPAP